MKKHTSETQKITAAKSSSLAKTKKITSRKNLSSNGLSNKQLIASLNSNISLAKGLLATLSVRHRSDWMRKYETTPPEHLQILLQDVMEEILSADSTLQYLSQSLSKRFAGICQL